METTNKDILLEKARQIIKDLTNLSHLIIEREDRGDNTQKGAWIFSYRNALVDELQLVTNEIQLIQQAEKKTKGLINCHWCEREVKTLVLLPRPISSLCGNCHHLLLNKTKNE